MQQLPEYSVEGKKVLITGAGRGIGRGIALVLAEAGADVAVTGLTPTGVTAVAEEVRRLGRRGFAFTADATRSADMDRLARQAVAEMGSLDVLVNCVGDAIHKPVVRLPSGNTEGMTEEDWHAIVDVNLTEAFQGCRAFGPYFLERRRGVVINISGWAARRASVRLSAYSAAKGGLTRFTEAVALEWAAHGVRVNAIAPGMFPDPDQMTAEDYRRREEDGARRVPLGRLGRLREVGLLAVYLASDASAYVTGQTFVIDGGISVA
ncbi:MAG: SDR family oxidoreductase [Chloroflexi bacterium]|nr:SDR family oxidoreductase [Chloroflexota bacterium]